MSRKSVQSLYALRETIAMWSEVTTLLWNKNEYVIILPLFSMVLCEMSAAVNM